MSKRGYGEGSIEKLKSGRWRAVLSNGSDPVTGQRRKITFSHRNKSDVLAWVRERQAAMNRGHISYAGKTTLAEWFARWLAGKKNEVEPATYLWYKRIDQRWLTPLLGSIKLARLDVLSVQDFFAQLTRKGCTLYEQFKAGKALRNALATAETAGLIHSNPARKIKLPKPGRRELQCWNLEQARKFLNAAREDRLHAMYALALDGGLGPAELFGLRWGDLADDPPSVNVARNLEYIAGHNRIKSTKTPKRRRRVVIAPQTAALLAQHRQQAENEGLSADDADPVFCDLRGGWLRMPNVRRDSYLPTVKRAGVPQIRMYDLRHTSATLALAAGVNVKAVSERLGHESVEITLKYYAHVLPSMQEAAAKASERLYQ